MGSFKRKRLEDLNPVPKPVKPKPKPPPVIPPVVTPPAPALTMGLSIFCGFASERIEFGAVPRIQCPYPRPWDSLVTNDRKMMLSTPGMAPGTYDERELSVTLQQIAWMEEGKKDVCSYQIDCAMEQTNWLKMPNYRPRLASPMLMTHCAENHPADSKVKYFLSDWDVSAQLLAPNSGDSIWEEMIANGWNRSDVETAWILRGQFIGRHAKKGSYFEIDDRPVFMRGWAHLLPEYERVFGITPKRIADILRSEVRAATGKVLYLISTQTDASTWPLHKEWGFNAVTQYALHGHGWAAAMGAHRHWRGQLLAFAKESGLDVWIPATCGFDSRAWDSPEPTIYIPTIPEYIEHIKEARQFARDNYKYTRGIVMEYAGTEIGEGGIWFPMMPGQLHDGDELMRAHAAACT